MSYILSKSMLADLQWSTIPWWAWIVGIVVVAGLIMAVAFIIGRKKNPGDDEEDKRKKKSVKKDKANNKVSEEKVEIEKSEVAVLDEAEEIIEEVESEEEDEETTVKIVEGFGIVARYKKSFLARLIQSSDETKNYYSALKNELLSYKKVKSRISWNYDSLNAGRTKIAKFNVRGKTLKLYLALNPDDYADSKYKVERSESKRYEEVPCMYKITNPRRLKYAMELIADVAEKYGLNRGAESNEDFVMPYETTEALIKKELIKELISEEAYEEYMRRKNQAGNEKISNEFVSAADIIAMLSDKGAVSLTNEADEFAEDEGDETEVKYVEGFGIVARYKKSFLARLIQSSDETKNYYSALKNELLSYKKVKSRISWNYDSLNAGRTKIAKFNVRGKTLKLYLALNPDDYADSKYKVERSESKRYEEVPCMYKITNPRRLKYAMELIADVAEKYGLNRGSESNEDFVMPYETTEALIKKELIKELISEEAYEEYMRRKNQATVDKIHREFVSAAEVNAMISDEVAVSLVEDVRKTRNTYKPNLSKAGSAVSKSTYTGKKGIINIDMLSTNFGPNDRVTLEELKAKKLVNKNVGHVKVLARGVLDKPLEVELQDYSIEAVKMIVLTGGKVKRV